MIKSYTYSAFGLIISSEFECPELIASTGEPDVSVRFGTAPMSLNNPLFSGVRFQTSGQEFLLTVDSIARYYIENGNSITIDIFPNAEIDEVRLFLLGSAFGAIIHQRGLLPFHGSSVNINNSAIIFSGHSGAGKSTMAAAFHKRGYSLLSDDVSVISISEQGQILVQPGYPQMKLWGDSIKKLGGIPTQFPSVRKQLDKHNIPVNVDFTEHPLPLTKIYIISSRNVNEIEFAPAKGIEKFNLLKNHTYRFSFIAGSLMRSAHFSYLDTIAKQIEVIKIFRPTGRFVFDEIISIVLDNQI